MSLTLEIEFGCDPQKQMRIQQKHFDEIKKKLNVPQSKNS